MLPVVDGQALALALVLALVLAPVMADGPVLVGSLYARQCPEISKLEIMLG